LEIQEPGDGPEDLFTVIGQQNSGLIQRSELGPYCRVWSAAAHPAVFEPLGGRLTRRNTAATRLCSGDENTAVFKTTGVRRTRRCSTAIRGISLKEPDHSSASSPSLEDC
jgi:hypothetical protein